MKFRENSEYFYIFLWIFENKKRSWEKKPNLWICSTVLHFLRFFMVLMSKTISKILNFLIFSEIFWDFLRFLEILWNFMRFYEIFKKNTIWGDFWTPLGSPLGTQEPPRDVPEAPLGAPEAPRSTPRALRDAPTGSQDHCRASMGEKKRENACSKHASACSKHAQHMLQRTLNNLTFWLGRRGLLNR